MAKFKAWDGSGWGQIRVSLACQHLYPEDRGEPGPDVPPPYSGTEQVRRQAFLELIC